MDVELSRHLLSQERHATVSPETLELMGKEAANMYLDKGVSLNEAIVKLASAHPDFNAEQVKRVAEFANTAVYLAIHDKNKTAGASSSYPQFELADPFRVIQDMSDGAKPTTMTQTDVDYGKQPLKKDKVSSVQFNELMDGLFKTSSTELPYTKDSVLHEIMSTKEELVALGHSLATSGEQFDLMHKQASAEYYDHVKSHLLNGGSFADVAVAARSTGISNEKMASILSPVLVRLITEKVASPASLKDGANGISKVAHRVINDKHPLVSSFAAVAATLGEIEKVAAGIEVVDQQIKKVEAFIKEEFCAR